LMAMVEILEGIRISASRIKVVLAIEGIWVRQKFMMKASTTQIGVLTLTRGLAMWVVVIRRGLKSEIPMVIRERERLQKQDAKRSGPWPDGGRRTISLLQL
jgi:hypothetical protein